MERYSEAARRDACIVQWHAESLAGLHWPQKRAAGVLSVPPAWTAWPRMEKPGMPRDLIAFVSHADARHLRRRSMAAKALMLIAPYPARMPAMTPAKEARCVMAG